jgi:hypothetical protein
MIDSIDSVYVEPDKDSSAHLLLEAITDGLTGNVLTPA